MCRTGAPQSVVVVGELLGIINNLAELVPGSELSSLVIRVNVRVECFANSLSSGTTHVASSE